MKKLCLLLVLYLITTFQLSAQQKQGAYWYFGYGAGLNFNASPPVSDTLGKSVNQLGGATISDASGNLLFYSDGYKVFNRFHQVMPNGNNFNITNSPEKNNYCSKAREHFFVLSL